jgi:hypothetical protein
MYAMHIYQKVNNFALHTLFCMVRKSSGSKAKRPIDRTMPNIRIMSNVKDQLFEIAEKGETYSEVIQRLIHHYKATKNQKR